MCPPEDVVREHYRRVAGSLTFGKLRWASSSKQAPPGDKIGDEIGTDCFHIASRRVHSDPQIPHLGGATHSQ